MSLSLWQWWALLAAPTFLALVVMAGLHFKDPKQRGPLLFIACVIAAAAWPLLFPYWAIAFVWKVLGAVQGRAPGGSARHGVAGNHAARHGQQEDVVSLFSRYDATTGWFVAGMLALQSPHPLPAWAMWTTFGACAFNAALSLRRERRLDVRKVGGAR